MKDKEMTRAMMRLIDCYKAEEWQKVINEAHKVIVYAELEQKDLEIMDAELEDNDG